MGKPTAALIQFFPMPRPRFQFHLNQLLAATTLFGTAAFFASFAKRYQQEFLLCSIGAIVALGLGVCFLAGSDDAGGTAIVVLLGIMIMVVGIFCIAFFGGF